MNNQARRWMQTFFDAVTEPYGDTCWCPHADIYRGTSAWLVKFDLAGVRPEDLSVSVENGLLVVRGMRRDAVCLEGQQAYSMEISYNRFERSLQLPFDLASAEMRSEYRDGMLSILITPRGVHHE